MYPVNVAPQAIGYRRLLAVAVAFVAAFATTLVASPIVDRAPAGPLTSVVVREAPGSADAAEDLVRLHGGEVTQQLPLIDGFSATVPAGRIDVLESSPFIEAVTPNARLQLQASGWEDASRLNGLDPKTHPGSMYEVTKRVGARTAWNKGWTGQGVDIAVIDSGVAPVNGLTRAGKVINGPDLSFESQYDNLRYLDTFGHGTHMAGIMAGVDDETPSNYFTAQSYNFVGVAPDARVLSLKVADAHGVTDVSQVIAAIDWVIQHGQDDGLNVRVLNLSFGTDSTQSYVLDPLAFAVERAWHNGIVVVVAAGNDGNEFPLRNPAMDPYVVAVGAVDGLNTDATSDDIVPSFSNCGTSSRSVDVVAPGRSITSLRNPGSYADSMYPGAVVAERFFLGSGTSQAAAVVSGVAALIVDANPGWSPDQVKAAMTQTAATVGDATPLCQGAGIVDAARAASLKNPKSPNQTHLISFGTGSLEAARGTDHVTADGVTLQGEQDIMGNPWIGFFEVATACWTEGKGPWAQTVCEDYLQPTETLWDGGDWNGATWSGATWSGLSWTSATWSSATWSGLSWTGATWSSATWSGATWSSATWSGLSWTGATWSSATWSSATWSGATWSGLSWLGFTWGSRRMV